MEFKNKIKASFSRVKADIEGFKYNVTDWLIFLNGNQRNLFSRIDRLEKKLKDLEEKIELKYNLE